MTDVTTFSIPRVDWFRVLDDVLPFTGDSAIEPMLTGVSLTLTGKTLTAAATDRYTIGIREYVIDDSDASMTGGDFTILVPKRDLLAMAKFHVAHRRGLPQKVLNITVQGRVMGETTTKRGLKYTTVESGGFIQVESGGQHDATVTSIHKGLEWEFVDYAKLIPDVAKAEAIPGILWDAEKMSRFAKVHNPRRKTNVTFHGAHRPIRLDIGDQFIGLLMPCVDREAS